jgi:carboxylesterase
MPQPATISPSAYAADRGPTGALIIHGYGGSAAETRPMGEYLARRGMTVRCPLLAGHGTSPDDLRGIRWQEWAGQVESAFQELQARCDRTFVAGLSMGSLLALWLGAHHQDIAGLVSMAPVVALQNRLLWMTPGLRYLIKSVPPSLMEEEAFGDPEAAQRLWCYDEQAVWGAAELYYLQRWVRKNLASIRQPLLIYQGRLDNWLAPEAAQVVYDGVSSAQKQIVWLERSGHNLLVDGERETVWAQSYDWMIHLGGPGS